MKKVAIHAGYMLMGKNEKEFIGGEWWNEW